MKAIVVRQPWATLIALGVKQIETRPWPPNGPMRPDGVRGLPGCTLERGERMAIVAGKDKADVTQTGWTPWEPLMDPDRPGSLRHPLALGAVVCTVTVDDALPVESLEADSATPPDWSLSCGRVLYVHRPIGDLLMSDRFVAPPMDRVVSDQLPLGDFTPGRWGWLLSDPQPCTPVPCKGRQGVFRLPADVAAQFDTQEEE